MRKERKSYITKRELIFALELLGCGCNTFETDVFINHFSMPYEFLDRLIFDANAICAVVSDFNQLFALP